VRNFRGEQGTKDQKETFEEKRIFFCQGKFSRLEPKIIQCEIFEKCKE